MSTANTMPPPVPQQARIEAGREFNALSYGRFNRATDFLLALRALGGRASDVQICRRANISYSQFQPVKLDATAGACMAGERLIQVRGSMGIYTLTPTLDEWVRSGEWQDRYIRTRTKTRNYQQA